MALRDLLVFAIVFGFLPRVFSKPHIGILLWSWLSYMNPHRISWGLAMNFPFAQIVAIGTMIGMLFSKETKRVPLTGLTVLWMTYIIWMCITTLFAMFPDAAYEQLIKVLKIQLVTFFTIMLMGSKERLNMLVWIIVVSLGYYGIKGGIFTLQTGGNFHVWGPPNTFISDNNNLAVALVMILPLMNYLRINSQNRWIRQGLLISLLLTSVCVLGSQSRAALISGLSMAALLWLKTKNKLITAMAILLLIPMLFAFMPQSWHERMATIYTTDEEGNRESSAHTRIIEWKMVLNLANHKPLGAGFNPWSPLVYTLYSNDAPPGFAAAAHSIYFGPLAEHGWIGLAMFVTILILAWRTGSRVIHQCRGHPDLEWLANLVRMVQLGLIAYCTGGAFHNLAYFDLPWHFVSIMVLARAITEEHSKATEAIKGNNRYQWSGTLPITRPVLGR
ncbi:MAG: putative O-glycosylation ligase, exosortase A system-associated [Candidatus Competibacteraceae bacterium]